MIRYSVWFVDTITSQTALFISNVTSQLLAERIAENLVQEGFTSRAWVERD
jgi:hypothetical protein